MKRSDITTQMILEAFENAEYPDIYLQGKTNAPLKVIYAAMERELDAGNIEYGLSISHGWLTDQGKQKLTELSGVKLSGVCIGGPLDGSIRKSNTNTFTETHTSVFTDKEVKTVYVHHIVGTVNVWLPEYRTLSDAIDYLIKRYSPNFPNTNFDTGERAFND